MATTNLGKVSVTPKGEYDPLVTYERLDVISHNGSSYIVKQTSTGVTPIEGEFYALIAEKGDGGSFLEKSYKTYAAMELDKPNLTANISTRVSNDSDTTKNGSYTYDGTVFTRSQYDSKVVTDKIISDTAIAVQDAINNTAIEGGVLADTFVVATPNNGTIARSQRDKNTDRITIDDFGGDFTAAGAWLKADATRICHLFANKTYTLPTGDVYFNQYVCEQGKASVIVPESTTLIYENTDGYILLKGIDYIVLGHRVDAATPNSAEIISVYKISVKQNQSVDINNVSVRFLLDIGNKSSWSDDEGRSRGGVFIYYSLKGDSIVSNCNIYGGVMLAAINLKSSEATHKEYNNHGFNVETLFYLKGECSHGDSSKLSITNTLAQQKYWKHSDFDDYPNGLDVIMCEANHLQRYVIDDIYAHRAIERAIYVMSGNVYASNITEEYCLDASHIKNQDSDGVNNLKGAISLKNSVSIFDINNTTETGGHNISGYTSATFSDIRMVGKEGVGKTFIPFKLFNNKEFKLKDVDAKNIHTLFQYSETVGTVSLADIKLYNDTAHHRTAFPQILYSVPKVGVKPDVFLSDISVEVNKSVWGAGLPQYGYTLGTTNLVVMNNCESITSVDPFRVDTAQEIRIKDCRFIVATAESPSAYWSRRFNKQANTGLYLVASTFSFRTKYVQLGSGLNTDPTAEITFNKQHGVSPVPVIDYWDKIELSIPLSVGDGSTAKILDFPLPSSFNIDVTVSYKNDYVKYIHNGNTYPDSGNEAHGTVVGTQMKFTYDNGVNPNTLNVRPVLKDSNKVKFVQITVPANWVDGTSVLLVTIKRV